MKNKEHIVSSSTHAYIAIVVVKVSRKINVSLQFVSKGIQAPSICSKYSKSALI